MSELHDNNGTRTPSEPPRSYRKLLAWSVFALVIVLLLASFDKFLEPIRRFNAILAPVYIGLVIAYICNPILRFFERKVFYKLKRTMNRAFSMILTYLFVILIIAGVVWLIVPQLKDSINDFQINGTLYIERVLRSVNNFIHSLPFEISDNGDFLTLEKILSWAMNLVQKIDIVNTALMPTFTFLKNLLVGIFVSIYVLLAKDRLIAGCRRIGAAFFSDKNDKLIGHYIRQANEKFGGFLVGKMVDSLIVGFTCAIFFSIFKIPYPILIAVIIGVTDFIPFFGPFIGAIPSAIIIFIADPPKALLFILLILVVQQIDGNLLAPLILGEHTGLSSLGVLIAITVMGGFFGFIGMLIGVPVFALIITVLDDITKHRLRAKGMPSDLYSYYAADAFIRPSDEEAASQGTITQRFVHWVVAVVPEMESEDYDPSRARRVINVIRVWLLEIGNFFKRIFSVKQIPEDHRAALVTSVRRRGMNNKRTFWRTVFLSIITLGIYNIYLIELIAETTNLSCARDGRRTWGFFPYLLFSILTLGIFPLIWHCTLIKRFCTLAEANGEKPQTTVKHYLCWTLPGALTIVGPFIAWARFFRAYNQCCRIFNESHRFPVTRRILQEEAAEGAANLAALRAAKAAKKAALLGEPIPEMTDAVAEMVGAEALPVTAEGTAPDTAIPTEEAPLPKT
ncbi:MAG: AI-2E family transporter [Clostridia bacterium]|nr:AI-2E family transporter [Clostridia bacterium]